MGTTVGDGLIDVFDVEVFEILHNIWYIGIDYINIIITFIINQIYLHEFDGLQEC